MARVDRGVVCKGLSHRKMYGEKVLREGRKGIIYVLKFSFSV